MTTKTLDVSQIKALFKNPTFVPFLVIWITHGIGGFGITFILPNVICKCLTLNSTYRWKLLTLQSCR